MECSDNQGSVGLDSGVWTSGKVEAGSIVLSPVIIYVRSMSLEYQTTEAGCVIGV